MAGRAAALSEPGKADSIAEIQTRRDFVREAWLAASACIRWIPAPSPESAAAQENARALVFLPAIGLALGVMLALCDRALYGVVGRLPASAIIVFAGTAVCGGLFPFGVARTVTALIGQSSLVK